MKQTEAKERNRLWQSRGFHLGLVVTMVFGLLIGLLNWNVQEVSANVQDYSLYYRASEVATAFGTDMAPSTDEDSPESSAWLNDTAKSNAGNMGGLLGYSRSLSEDEEGIVGWVTSRFSANSMSYNYEQLSSLGGANQLEQNGLLAYGLYGAALQEAGLVDSSDIGFMDKVVGFLFSMAYWVAQIVPFIFNIILNLLTVLNPFQLFFGAFEGLSDMDIPLLGDLAAYMTDIFEVIQDLSIVVTVPVLIGLTAISIFMFQGNAGKKILRVVVRVFMIFAGLPLIGATYTAVIGDMASTMEMGTPFANYVIATQFVDSEGWMKYTRLAPPTENPIEMNSSYRDESGSSGAPSIVSRETVLEINANRVYGNRSLQNLFSVSSAEDSLGFDDGSSSVLNQNIGQDLLSRYRSGARFSASDYEGFVKSDLDELLNSKQIASMFEPNASDLSDNDDYADMFNATEGAGDFDDIQWSIYNLGGLHFDGSKFTTSMPNGHTDEVSNGGAVSAASYDTYVNPTPIGLSPLAMYNFLNTNFGATSMTVYSPETSSSTWSSNDYASVAKPNTGFFGVVYSLESFVLILGSAIIGLVYAFGLFQIIVASIPRIMSGVFGTAVGSLAMITKLLVSTIVLILEIIGTMLLYTIFDGLLMTVIRGTEGFLEGVMDVTNNAMVTFAGGMLKSSVVIALGIGIVIFAMKNRTKFAKMIEEVTTDLITKLMGGLDNSMNQGNMFHNQGDVGNAAKAGTVLGADGTIGGEGSGIFNSANAAGQNPKAALGMKDAIRESFGQEALKKNAMGDNYEGKSKGDLLKDVAGRYGDYKKADVKDKLAAGMGGMATGLTLAGISDLDGGARQRIAEKEEQDRRAISDEARGIGKGMGDEANLPDESDVSEPSGVDAYTKANEEIDNAGVQDILARQDTIDPEVTALESDNGEVLAEQEDYGSVADAVDATNTQGYEDFDSDADAKMVEAFGDEAGSVSLDKDDDHPDAYQPLTPEHDNYIDALGEAADAQLDSVEKHVQKAQALEGQADNLDDKAAELEALDNPTRAQEQEAVELREEATDLRKQAENHKKQGRKDQRKAQKLLAKQHDAQAQRHDALAQHAEHQSSPVKAAKEMVKAENELKQLNQKAQRLDSEINDMVASGETEGLTEKQAELAQTRQEISQKRQELPKLQKEAVDRLAEAQSGGVQFSGNPSVQKMLSAENDVNDLSQKAQTLSSEIQNMKASGQTEGLSEKQAELSDTRQQLAQKKQEMPKLRQEAVSSLAQASKGNSAVQQMVKAETKMGRLSQKADRLNKEITQMKASGQTQGLAQKQAELSKTNREMGKTQQALPKLRQEASKSLSKGQDGAHFEPLRDNTPEQNAAYARQQGWSDDRLRQEIEQTPTKEQYQTAQVEAARVLGQMAEQTGKTPEATAKKQQEFVRQQTNKRYGRPPANAQTIPKRMASASSRMDSAAGRLEKANTELERIKNSGLAYDAKITKPLEQEITRASQEYTEAEQEYNELKPQQDKMNERKAFMQFVSGAQKENSQRLQAQSQTYSRVKQSNAAAKKVRTRQQSVGESTKSTLMPKNAHVLKNHSDKALPTKARVLKAMGVESKAQYEQKMNDLNKGIHQKQRELAQLQKRYGSMGGSTNAVKKTELARRIATKKKEIDREVQRTAPERQKLQKNATGLYAKGYIPKNKRLTRGRPIDMDVAFVTRTAEDLGMKMHELSKLPDVGLLDKSNKLRHKALTKKVNSLRTQLKNANINPEMLQSSNSITQLVKGLNTEYDGIVGERFDKPKS